MCIQIWKVRFSGYNLVMQMLTPLEPVDYLVIGHLTRDLTPEGPRLGGTASFAALTAQALGLRVGVVTSWAADLPLSALRGIPIANYSAEVSTTFENIHTSMGRVQYIRQIASSLDYYHIPEPWRNASIIHLGPVAQEIEPGILGYLSSSLVGLTPQGWMRAWDEQGKIYPTDWPEASFVLHRAGATVISLEDVNGDESIVDEMAASCRILAVTEGRQGSRVFWSGDVRRFYPPEVNEVDTIGAGDIYAAAFFARLFTTRDPWEAGRFATLLAACSVTRPYFSGIPTAEEIYNVSIEVF